ncbi:MAG: hypothetical protein QOJ89_363 [bacterium]
MHRRLPRRGSITVGAGLAALVVAGVAYAAIPGSDGVIHGCYNSGTSPSGQLRVIDAAAGGKCAKNEKALDFNQQGPKGDKGDPCLSSDPACRGDQGATGPTGPTGPDGADGASPMWAVLDGDRMELVRGSHAVAFKRSGTTPHGFYLVTFDRDITQCAFVGTAGAAHFGNPAGYNVTVGASAGEPTDVLVATRSDFNTLADTSFHLAVFC